MEMKKTIIGIFLLIVTLSLLVGSVSAVSAFEYNSLSDNGDQTVNVNHNSVNHNSLTSSDNFCPVSILFPEHTLNLPK